MSDAPSSPPTPPCDQQSDEHGSGSSSSSSGGSQSDNEAKKSPPRRSLSSTGGMASKKPRNEKKNMEPFRYKSAITVAGKALRSWREHGIRCTVFVECPESSLPPQSAIAKKARKTRPSIMVVSPIPAEDFAKYFLDVISPGVANLTKDDRYHTHRLLEKIRAAREERDTVKDSDVQVETLYLCPETEPYTKNTEKGTHPLLTTPFHTHANI